MYMHEMTLLGERFLRAVDEAFSIPSGELSRFLSDQHRLKMVRYPPDTSEGCRQGVGPHKDSSGWWTFLLQASPPEVKGLQVLSREHDSWIDVPSVPGTFVVNTGQPFEVLSRGVCRATIHRVMSGSSERFSVPFFLGVRRDLTKVEALTALHEYFGVPDEQESQEALAIDSPFLRGNYHVWGEAQLRTKIRSHRENGRLFYSDVYPKYINET
jgi:isopenicillin N synthase-like dioxygenase